MEYELMYLIADSKKEDLSRIMSEIDSIIETAGGTKQGQSINFEKKLAYEIKHNWRGIYVVQRFTTPDKDTRDEAESHDIVSEVTRQINIHKDLLRHILVTTDGLPSLEEYTQNASKSQTEDKKVLKEKGEKIDGKLEKVLKI